MERYRACCDVYVCLSMYVSVREYMCISPNLSNRHQLLCMLAYLWPWLGRHIWRCCDTLYTSGFMDDVIFVRENAYTHITVFTLLTLTFLCGGFPPPPFPSSLSSQDCSIPLAVAPSVTPLRSSRPLWLWGLGEHSIVVICLYVCLSVRDHDIL